MSLTIIRLDPSHLKGQKPPIACPIEGMIAGGAIRRWFTGSEKLSDIDCFFKNQEALNHYRTYLLDRGAKKVGENPNAETYILDGIIVQCIKLRFFNTLEEMFDSFDFTLCQFAWNGSEVYASVDGMLSVLRNHLGVHKIAKEYAVDSLRRAFKYAKKGFYPCNGTLLDLVNSLRILSEEEVKNAIMISPNGGNRIMRID